MAYEHTNRKGTTYYLHRRERKGKTRYVFCRTAGQGAVNDLPDGYEVRETVHGQVSLARMTKRLITPVEEAMIRKVLPPQCQLEIKGREITLFEPRGGAGGGMHAQYEPVMKLTLVDADERDFEVTRWRYSGNGGWMYPLQLGKLKTLTRTFVPHIGKQSFFNLM